MNKLVNGFYSRKHALAEGWYEAKTRAGRLVRVTHFKRSDIIEDMQYIGLVNQDKMVPRGKLARKHND